MNTIDFSVLLVLLVIWVVYGVWMYIAGRHRGSRANLDKFNADINKTYIEGIINAVNVSNSLLKQQNSDVRFTVDAKNRIIRINKVSTTRE